MVAAAAHPRLRAGRIPGLVVIAMFPLYGGPSLLPTLPLCDVAWPPMVFLSMSGNMPWLDMGIGQGLPRQRNTALADLSGLTELVGKCVPQGGRSLSLSVLPVAGGTAGHKVFVEPGPQ